MLNGPANLRKFHWRKCDKFYLKDPYFLCHKTLHNGIEICQDWYPSMCRLLNHGSCVFIWYVYFGLAKFLDIHVEHKHCWTVVALYSLVVPWKIIRYIPLSNSFWGILASIIEMLQYGKYNSHSACHSGHYCCKNKNYSYLPCLQNKHSLRPCANVCMSTTWVPWRFLAAVCWWKSEPLLRPKLHDWSKQ